MVSRMCAVQHRARCVGFDRQESYSCYVRACAPHAPPYDPFEPSTSPVVPQTFRCKRKRPSPRQCCRYRAPELLLGPTYTAAGGTRMRVRYGKAVDFWAIGCLLVRFAVFTL